MTLTGANVAFGKAIVAEVPVYVFVLFRFVVASAALALLVRREPGPKLSEMTGAEWRDLALMALLGMVGFTVLMFEGLKRTAAADAGIITATLPAVVAVLGVAFAGERLSRAAGGAVALAVAGLVLVQATERGRRGGDARRQPAGRRRGAVRGELRGAGQAAGAALPAAAAGARRQSGRAGAGVPLALIDAADLRCRARCGRRCGCSASGMRSRPASSACGCGIAACRMSRPGSPGSRRLQSPWPRLPRPRCYLGETIGGWRLAGAALVIAAIVLGALAPRKG